MWRSTIECARHEEGALGSGCVERVNQLLRVLVRPVIERQRQLAGRGAFRNDLPGSRSSALESLQRIRDGSGRCQGGEGRYYERREVHDRGCRRSRNRPKRVVLDVWKRPSLEVVPSLYNRTSDKHSYAVRLVKAIKKASRTVGSPPCLLLSQAKTTWVLKHFSLYLASQPHLPQIFV